MYGLAERLFASVIPWLLKPSYVYQPPNRVAVIALLLSYAIFGALLQLLLALLLRRGRLVDVAVRLAVIAVFAANFVFEYLPPYLAHNRRLYGYALVAQCLALAFAVSVEMIGRRIGAIALSLLLLLPWYLIIDLFADRRIGFKALAACASVVLVLLGAWVLRRLPARIATIAAVAAGALIAGVALLAPQSVDAAPVPRRSRSLPRPNIILITLDTVRADHLSVYGYSRDTTPVLARFAREATLYENAFSSGDMTLSTHASLFTGLEPRSHGAHYTSDFQYGRPLAPGVPTLAAILGASGYDTIGVVANSGFLGHAFGLNRGFRYYDQRVEAPLLAQMSEYCIGRGVVDAVRRTFARDARFVNAREASSINRDVEAALRQRGQRFFLFVNYLDAHWPYHSPASGGDPTPDDYLRHSLAGDASPEYCNVLKERYDDAIRYLDQQIGQLFDVLRREGIYDDALIIITSDHGESFGERGRLSHGNSVYQDQIRVPLLVKLPHQNAARVESAPVSSVDVFDMVLSRDRAHDAVMAEHFDIQDKSQVAITDGKLKLIRNPDGSSAVYDLQADPLEQHDVTAQPQYAARMAALAERLDARIAIAERERQRVQPASNIDETYLRSLGYLR